MTSSRPTSIPGFLGLGVMRGGTTWLWKQLKAHPDVWLPPVKELNYFTRRHPIRVPQAGGAVHVETPPNLFRRSLQRFRWNRMGHYLRTYGPRSTLWRWRFYRGPVTPEWYRSLFDPAGDRLAGDITPHYSALGEEGIAEVVATLPDVRCILILRDPVDRDWSHAVHFLTVNRGRPRDALTGSEVLELATHPSFRSRGDYLTILERWERALPPERLKVCFFDDVQSRPAELLREIEDYLGIREHLPPGLERRINASHARRIPAEVERELAARHLPALEALADRFGAPVDGWLAHARDALR